MTTAGDAPTVDRLVITDPSTGSVVGDVPASTERDARLAVDAAERASAAWSRTSPAERAAALKAGAHRLREHAIELAELQTAEMGKPIGDSHGGVAAGIAAVEQYAELGPLHRGRSLQGGWDATDVMTRAPYGPAACVVPWNDPVAVGLGLVAACLVAGNTVVLKPSERAPLALGRAAELLALPHGVLEILQGDAQAGRPLVADTRIRLVCHVGSTATGREIAAVCAEQLKKAILELGGKDPLIVDGDVDPEWAAEQAAIGAYANAGQICTSVERVYVHRSIATAFIDALVRRAQSLRRGPAADPSTELGPLVDERMRAHVHDHVTGAVAAGAELRCGGQMLSGTGSFYPATVLTACRPEMDVMREETFGPVAPIAVVDSFDEALHLADDTPYGLAATVLTASLDHAQRARRELAVGTVKINAVFGGAPGGSANPHGQSGIGLGYGPELLDEVTRYRVVHVGPAHPR